MAITVGRAGTDATLPLPSPTTIDRDGDRVRLRGNLWSEISIAAARALRDQVIGLDPSNSPGAPARPVIYSPGDIARFARIIGAAAPSSRAAEATGVWPYDIELEWVTASHAPLVEARQIGAVRAKPDGTANAHSITSSSTIAWFAPGVGAVSLDGLPSGASSVNRTSSDGVVPVYYDSSESFFDATVAWYAAPADYYDGAAAITRSVNGTFFNVVGSQMPNSPTGWAIGNGLVALVGSSSASVTQFTVLWYVGSAFESTKTVRVTYSSGFTTMPFEPASVRIMRNTPECCTLRLHLARTGILSRTYLDLTIRRGARHAECLLVSDEGRSWGARLVTGEAGTNHTSGVHATAADADGNKYWFTSPQAVTTDTTNGGVELTSSAEAFAFAIGLEPGTPGSGDAYTDQVNQYFAAADAHQRVVVP